MQIQNNTKAPRVLPDGTEIPALGFASVDDAEWAAHKKNRVVKAWLDAKDLEEIKEKASKADKDGDGKPDAPKK